MAATTTGLPRSAPSSFLARHRSIPRRHRHLCHPTHRRGLGSVRALRHGEAMPRRHGFILRALGSDDDGVEGGFSSSDLSVLARRMASLKRQEDSGSTATMQVIVLDATLPGQRLTLRFHAADAKRRLNAGTELGPLVGVGDKYAMLGQAPSSGQVLPLGTEVQVTRVDVAPPDSNGTPGDTEVELVGVRRLRIEGQPFNENGVAMAQVTFMKWAPEDTPPMSAEDRPATSVSSISGDHPAASRARASGGSSGGDSSSDAEDDGGGEGEGEGGVNVDGVSRAEECEQMSAALEALVDEWSSLVTGGGFERQPDQLELIRSHIGDMPPEDDMARRAAWVGALINPIPALGVAYEIRPALLMARDTHGMLKVATDGIKLSIEHLQSRMKESEES